jgi:uncharacterized protein (TIGR03437 family)
MNMRNARTVVLSSFFCLLAAPAWAQTIGGGNCSAANLNGTYSLALDGRAISATGSFAGSFQGIGTATFDGQSVVTFAGIVNTNMAAGQSFKYSGNYTIPANCYGTITLTTGSTATFTLVAWSAGSQYNIAGSDATYVYSGSGNNFQPACATATLSGEYTYQASGFTLSGTTQNGSENEGGVFQFDGQGNVSARYTITSAGLMPVTVSSKGNYSVTSGCLATATLNDSTGEGNAVNFVITATYGEALLLLEANSQFVRTGSAHSAFLNPTESIGNVASYALNYTPAGSVFALFGTGLATNAASAPDVPLPTTLLSTTVTVNGELAPLFYVNSGQIDAQIPWDIPGGTVASVVVTNENVPSNAAAIYVPATGTPGISVYNTDRAVVVNVDGSVNSATNPAKVGDEVIAYFTGGGPVQASGQLVSGAPAPSGLSPVTGGSTVTVGQVNTNVVYIGLTPGGIGLYQANFIVPQIAKGTYPVAITISDQASNRPLMTVSN